MLIEVADTSLEYERQIKGGLYTARGIAEYWIVNLDDRQVEVRTQPQADGSFAKSTNHGLDDQLAIPALEATISVPELWGSRSK